MKKILLSLLILGVFSLSAEVIYEPGLENKFPEIMAQGGSFHAVSEGYGALFTNPAGFRSEKGELTLLSINAAFTADLFTYFEGEGTGSTGDMLGTISDQIDNGVGLSVAPGIGWVGKGFGLGIVPEANVLIEGSSILSPSGALRSTIALVGGYSHRFDLGIVQIDLGGDVRPMYRVYAPADEMVENLVSSLGDDEGSEDSDPFDDLSGIAGTAMAFDAGTKVHFGPFIGSLTLRDIGGTNFDFYDKTSQELQDGDFLATGNATADTYVTPMSLTIGAAFDPEIPVFNPKIHAQYTKTFGAEDTDAPEESLLSNIQMGAELEVFGFIRPRIGINGGYFSAGIGIDLFIIELNAALYAEESGERAGKDPKMGGSIELAIRI